MAVGGPPNNPTCRSYLDPPSSHLASCLPMKVKLSVHRLSDKLEEYVFESFPLVIGRSPDADITLEDRWVSRRHCEIHIVDGGLVVRDLGSKHGTLINEATITEALLQPGDQLSVGLSTLIAAYDRERIGQHGAETSLSSCD